MPPGLLRATWDNLMGMRGEPSFAGTEGEEPRPDACNLLVILVSSADVGKFHTNILRTFLGSHRTDNRRGTAARYAPMS
jgi:hypothetical protein